MSNTKKRTASEGVEISAVDALRESKRIARRLERDFPKEEQREIMEKIRNAIKLGATAIYLDSCYRPLERTKKWLVSLKYSVKMISPIYGDTNFYYEISWDHRLKSIKMLYIYS